MAEADRIGSLPRDVKISILSLVDLKSAVRTSALAHSWRHLWTFLPCLRLAYDTDRLGDSDTSEGSTDWLERIRRLVSRLRGPLLVLELRGCPNFDSDQLRSVLDLLLQKGGLETIDLCCSLASPTIHLPPFHSLRVLRLWWCHVILPQVSVDSAISPVWPCFVLKSPIMISISSSIHPIT